LLARFIALAHWVRARCCPARVEGLAPAAAEGVAGAEAAVPAACEVSATVEELAALWECSRRAAQQTLRRLSRRGLVSWRPRAGRGRRSALQVTVHPVHAYLERALAAARRQRWVEAAFWLEEIDRECPCLPDVSRMRAEIRARLGLPPRGARRFGEGSACSCAASIT